MGQHILFDYIFIYIYISGIRIPEITLAPGFLNPLYNLTVCNLTA